MMLPAESDVPSSGRRFSTAPGLRMTATRAARTGAGYALTASVAVLLGSYVRVGSDARRELAAGEALSAELDEAAHLQRDCGEHQLRMVGELAAGRMGLAEDAADGFEAGRARPVWLAGVVRTFPADPDDRVRVARVLVASVKEATAANPDRYVEAVDRVSAEFDRMTNPADG